MKTIFITGGTTGLGWALAQYYAHAGYAVGICGRDATKLARNFPTGYPSITFYQVDVTDKLSLQTAVHNFINQHDNRLDIMLANAGRSTGSKQQMPDFATLENIIEINLRGVTNAFAIATELFLKQSGHTKGHLVAIGSVAGFVGLPGAAAYSASKAAVLTLCESLAIDFPKYGIDVTAIAPGFIDTPLTQQNDHKMPFLMSADKAARLIKTAIDKRKPLYIFPFRMRLFITFAALLPRSWYRAIMRLKIFNYSRGL
ncbi:MAG: SDR family NAD(P)-dependent oxidoreductase [Gammaproteobacteria bacterium]|nr:SDR family NAD(P)-dependent oxidoreductase [Gammaproteobacteria bacterium]